MTYPTDLNSVADANFSVLTFSLDLAIRTIRSHFATVLNGDAFW